MSRGGFTSFNLAHHVGDTADAVRANRAALRSTLPREPQWLDQQHGNRVLVIGDRCSGAPAASLDLEAPPGADACVAFQRQRVCAVLTADCLPIVVCDRTGTRVGIIHAGWRGLVSGVIEATLGALECRPHDVLAWIGPGIGAAAYEVGKDVRDRFERTNPALLACFRPSGPKRWHADLSRAARLVMQWQGVAEIHGGTHCTHREHDRFFSYRRDGITGRMATVAWIE